MKTIVAFFVVVAGTMIGCAGHDSQPQDDSTVYRTIVYFNSQGEPTVTTKQITRAEQRRQVEARLGAHQNQGASQQGIGIGSNLEAITVDYDCYGASMWMFDRESMSGNEICFYGQGTAYLPDYNRTGYYCGWPSEPGCELGNSWAFATRSYWPGSESGYFLGRTGMTSDIFGYENFASWGHRVDSAGYWAAVSIALILAD